jgi:3-oxoacyl-[acyl-carrier-protein] synthase II
MGGVSPIGSDWKTVAAALEGMRSGVRVVPELGEIQGMDTRLGAPVDDFETPSEWPRKRTRSMGRVSLLAAGATEAALADAGLADDPVLGGGRAGIAYGSTSGSPPAMAVYGDSIINARSLKGIRATDYIQLMSHTVPANLAQFFRVRGRILSTCSACTSGSQGIGFGYEQIQTGKQDVVLTGGSEEFHVIDAAVFDIMYATSKRNDAPETSPRPFDADRDGLVVGEGAATLVLEELEHARARGARIYAEVIGYGTNCDGVHITNPDRDGMAAVIRLALADAGIEAGAVDYVNAHGTATEAGDIAESHATLDTLGGRVPVSSLKSYMGHTLGACGAIEAWMTIEMMRHGSFSPTLNLDRVDPRCAELDYVVGGMRAIDAEVVMSNNFAFGGINTSLLFRRWPDDRA